MRILLAGGGSIGHISPSVAVARALMTMDPTVELLAICARREEEENFLKAEKIAHRAVTLPRLRLRSPLAFFKAWGETAAIIRDFRPDAVFCKGGSVSVPAALQSKLRGIPVVLHESDAKSGRANRLIARIATVVCRGLPGNDLGKRAVVTGNPVRREISAGNRERGLTMTGLSGTRPILLVCGGSQGSLALNRAVIRDRDALLSVCDIVHLTGQGKEGAAPCRGYWSAPFSQNIADLYAIASLALSRSGAGSIGELSANAIPAILVPLEGVAQDHQTANAVAAIVGGGFLLLTESQLKTKLIPIVSALLGDLPALHAMGKRSKNFGRPDAAEHIARLILDLRRR